ncbi:MAG: fluoride efflux transporter CrcB [Bacillota bacterium]|nr:fluoride efflux transporter CrcB [Bacillota bacterium]
MEIIFVGLGGAIGACSRFLITKISTNYLPIFPLGTLISNIIAGFFIGFIIGIERQALFINPKVKVFLTSGLLGGLSTFSTFSMDTVSMFESGKYALAIGNILLNVGLSFICVFLGLMVAKIFVKAN